MPGIIGMISQKRPEGCRGLVKAMVATMQHEKFYVSGTCFIPEMGLYAGWAAHGNSFAVNGPSWNEQRDVALIVSGECFLDSQTGSELRRQGHDIGNDKSTWPVHLYEEQGEQFFGNLNGLFSGLLIDKRQEKVFLFNDRYGVERIYFHETSEAFYFASEAKALLRILEQLRSFDEEGVAQYLALGCTLESRTLFHGIEMMPGASLWSFENGNCQKKRYFTPDTWEAQPTLSAEEFQTQFQETFKRILPRYFELDSEMGISLTAGLDTRMIMACRPETKEKPVCFTYSGERLDTLDARIAGRIAAVCGLEHHALRIGRDFFDGFASFADRTVYLTDGYFGVLSAHEIYMSRLARQLSPVRLTGNYGGEVLRGVSTFKPIPLTDGLVNPQLFPAMRSSIEQVAGWKKHQFAFAAFREVPWNLFGNLQAGRSQIGFRTPYLDNEIVALAYRTPESLRRSRATALHLVKENHPSLAAIPTDRAHLGHSRGIGNFLRRSFAEITFKLDYYNNEGFPSWLSPLDPLFHGIASQLGLVGLHKHLHYRRWLKYKLAAYASGALEEAWRLGSPFWNIGFLKQIAANHMRGRGNYVLDINAVLTLEAVDRLLFRKFSCEGKISSLDTMEDNATASVGKTET
jgi:asparagine synthase (glutamine-hydrolysing)